MSSGRFAPITESDKLTLTQIGFYFGALLWAELKKKMPMLHVDKYQHGVISYNSLVCKTISGRQIRFNNVLSPKRHIFYFLQANSPLVTMSIIESHRKVGCRLGLEAYIKNMMLMGISAQNLPS